MNEAVIRQPTTGCNLPPRIANILWEVAAETGFHPNAILGESRRRKLAAARHEAMRRVRALDAVVSLPTPKR